MVLAKSPGTVESLKLALLTRRLCCVEVSLQG